jgi:hypothetical protein
MAKVDKTGMIISTDERLDALEKRVVDRTDLDVLLARINSIDRLVHELGAELHAHKRLTEHRVEIERWAADLGKRVAKLETAYPTEDEWAGYLEAGAPLRTTKLETTGPDISGGSVSSPTTVPAPSSPTPNCGHGRPNPGMCPWCNGLNNPATPHWTPPTVPSEIKAAEVGSCANPYCPECPECPSACCTECNGDATNGCGACCDTGRWDMQKAKRRERELEEALGNCLDAQSDDCDDPSCDMYYSPPPDGPEPRLCSYHDIFSKARRALNRDGAPVPTPEEAALREVREIWIGSELPSEPRAETAPEAYAQRIALQMYEAACAINRDGEGE